MSQTPKARTYGDEEVAARLGREAGEALRAAAGPAFFAALAAH